MMLLVPLGMRHDSPGSNVHPLPPPETCTTLYSRSLESFLTLMWPAGTDGSQAAKHAQARIRSSGESRWRVVWIVGFIVKENRQTAGVSFISCVTLSRGRTLARKRYSTRQIFTKLYGHQLFHSRMYRFGFRT
jgi:hypothetical protein